MVTLQLNVEDLSVEPRNASQVTINFDVDFDDAVEALVEAKGVSSIVSAVNDNTEILNCIPKEEVLEHFGITESED
jgi:hypothetical protein